MKTRILLNAVRLYGLPVACAVVALVLSTLTFAQTTISTGSIQGTVTNPSGAVVPGAKISIRNKATNQVIETTSTSSGTYASGALIPGQYAVRIEAKGFRTVELPVVVEVNTTAAATAKLTVGESSQIIEVQGTSLAVNTEQSTVQGVLTSQQIENLPINGRNFLDLAQLEPGVQIQDGARLIPPRMDFPRFHLAADLDALLASRWMESISAMRRSARRPRTFRWERFRNRPCSSLLLTFRQS
jgi:hypothetical protein